MKRISHIALLLWCCLLVMACPSFAGSVWNELGSAGNLPGTANITSGAGSLDLISGNLMSVTEVDMYQIMISDFASFSAMTEDCIFCVDDPQLFLFDSAGRAVYMNDDGPSGSQSELPAGSPYGPTADGLYYLAIGWFDNEPFSALGRMFVDSIDTSGPDVGGSSPITFWNNDAIGRDDLPTAYNIHLAGASFAVPEPGTLVLLATGLAGLAGLRSRRQRV